MARRKEAFIRGVSEILVKHGVLKSNDVDVLVKEFAGHSQTSFDYFLLDRGLVTKDQLLPALSEYFQVPFVDVTGYLFDFRLVQSFPKDLMLRNVFIPQEEDEDILIVIAAHPDDDSLVPLIEEHVSYDIQFRVGLERDICDAVKEYSEAAEESEEAFNAYYGDQSEGE